MRPLNTTATHPFADNLLKQDFNADGPYKRRTMDRAVGGHLVCESLTMALGYR
jgi:hypothetical protein